MLILRILIIICGFLVFAVTSNATPQQSAKLKNPSVPNKVIVAENPTKLVNVNAADLATLQKVKGIGKKKAQAIVDYRTKIAPFKAVEELLKIKARGINKKWLDQVGKFLTV